MYTMPDKIENVETAVVFRGDRLRELRKEADISQEILSELIDAKQQEISRWENGIYNPLADVIVKIAQCFEVSTDYLLGLSTSKSAKERDIASLKARLTSVVQNREILKKS